MLRILLLWVALTLSVLAFESTDIQLLYSNQFDGDAFIYDTVDGDKTTVTFEHFRTFSYGDLYMFIDIMNGKKFDESETSVYTEIAPRLSLSKMSSKDISFSFIKDTFIAFQINAGHDYNAYLGGLGVDIDVNYFVFVNLNLYYKKDNIHDDATFQVTTAYMSRDYLHTHFEGFIDITGFDFNTQNQLLYNFSSLFNSKEQMYIGLEWIYYHYDKDSHSATTNALEAMLKYKF
jgi:nucleoside-specific outer membrane channel protein Tsx